MRYAMKPLDAVTSKMFPTLARFARRQWWLGTLGVVALLCALSFAGGVVVGSYRGRVADENYHAVVLRINAIEQFTQEHHPKSLRTTRAQSAVLIDQAEKRRQEQQP